MEVRANIKKTRTLKDFTRILIGFVCCLVILSFYQQLSLYNGGVIEDLMNKTIFLLVFNHLGFASVVSFALLLLFRFLERNKPGMGFRATVILFAMFLLLETLLIEHFVHNYTLFRLTDLQSGFSLVVSASAILRFCTVLAILTIAFYGVYRVSSVLNPFIGKMFPFTIILFLMVMGTSVTEKKPINRNKSIALITDAAGTILDFNTYEGEEFPLVHDWDHDATFADHLDTPLEKPNFVVIVIDGLSTDFLREGTYSGFMPFLDSLTSKSLYWNRFLANSNSKNDAVTNILGSLPQGTNGFTQLENSANRNSLYGLLKANGYHTGFYYGGNSALQNLNQFLKEEQVDVVIDKSRFNDTYKLQNEDRAGVTLGYPDSELYKKWGATYLPVHRPKLECFLNLSTSKPFSFSKLPKFIEKAEEIHSKKNLARKERRFINKNSTLFASLNYADHALRDLFKMYGMTKEYKNTVFLITGSGTSYVPKSNIMEEHNVPLLVYGQLVKEPRTFQNLVSHHDIAPSIIAWMQSNHDMELPEKTAWLGRGLKHSNSNILLSKANGGIMAMIADNHLIMGRSVSKIGKHFELKAPDETVAKDIKSYFKKAKAVNTYVTEENKILPRDYTIYESGKKDFSKEELVWISSVFNGKNFDNAYSIARNLAHEGNYDKALLFTEYILENTPGHIDAMILQGRIYAWKKHYNKSIAILEGAVDLHPFYHDGYAALLDVYYWSGNNARASYIYEKIKENHLETVELIKKVERCMQQIKGLNAESGSGRLVTLQFEDE